MFSQHQAESVGTNNIQRVPLKSKEVLLNYKRVSDPISAVNIPGHSDADAEVEVRENRCQVPT